MIRLNIQSKVGGCPLFDKSWKWKTDVKNPGNLSSLILSFCQFSRDIDEGKIGRVLFAKGDDSNRTSFNTATMRKRASRKKRESTNEAVEMVTTENDHIICALFVQDDFGISKAKELVHAITKEFEDSYGKKLKELEPDLESIGNNPEKAKLDTSFMPTFEPFNEIVEKMTAI